MKIYGYFFWCLTFVVLPASGISAESDEKEVLYWVAPMDSNYRRDEPGKSPMGMDLVPVYASDGDSNVVSIDPAVVQNLGVRTATVERGKLWRRIDTVGYVTFDERKISHVHLRTEGWVEKLNVKSNGERVKKGEVLFELYSRELVNAQEEYIQTLRGNNKHLAQATAERLQALGVSQSQIKNLRKTRKASQRVKIYAKQDGIIHGLNIREGMFVKPATEVMTLADLSSVWLLVDVFERQANWVEIGQPTEVSLPYIPGRIWEGNVEYVYPTIDEKTRTLRVRLRFDNPDESLKPNMYADVRLFAGPVNNVLSIPREALIRTGDDERVIIQKEQGKFMVREVVAGFESGDYIEIKAGLKEKDKVVVSGQFLIDSEASLKASFTRMQSQEDEEETGNSDSTSVNGMGMINAINLQERMINLTHEAIEALGWPEMTMDFDIADEVSLDEVKVGQEIHFSLVKGKDGNYQIMQIHVMQ